VRTCRRRSFPPWLPRFREALHPTRRWPLRRLACGKAFGSPPGNSTTASVHYSFRPPESDQGITELGFASATAPGRFGRGPPFFSVPRRRCWLERPSLRVLEWLVARIRPTRRSGTAFLGNPRGYPWNSEKTWRARWSRRSRRGDRWRGGRPSRRLSRDPLNERGNRAAPSMRCTTGRHRDRRRRPDLTPRARPPGLCADGGRF